MKILDIAKDGQTLCGIGIVVSNRGGISADIHPRLMREFLRNIRGQNAHPNQPEKFMQIAMGFHIQQVSRQRTGVPSPEAAVTFWLLVRVLF